VLFIIFVIFICTLLIIRNTNNNNKINNTLTFTNEDVANIWVFEGSKGLSYDYKIENDVAKQISTHLIDSSKTGEKRALVAINSGGFIIYIFLKDASNGMKREINILPKNDNSVFVIVKTRNNNGVSVSDPVWLSVDSPWLSNYLEKVKKEFELKL
jgi:hypothetical protein